MNWNQLQYVITIAQEKNITRAARKLFISQPSLSLSIQSLEKETGVTLFERNHGEMVLTYAGKLFYEWAVSTLQSNRQLNLKLSDISEQKRRLIRIGISPHRSGIILPSVLEKFCQDFPACEIHILEKPTYLLKKLLENNEIDLLIDVAHPDNINYQSDLLIKEEIIIAVPDSFVEKITPVYESETYAQHTVSDLASSLQIPEMDLKQLSSFPFIMLSEDHVLGNMSRKMCEAAAFHPDIRLICSNIETALTLTSRQLGITFIPEIFARQKRFSSQIRYYSIRNFHDVRQICLVYHKNLYQHTQLSALIQLFRQITPDLYR